MADSIVAYTRNATCIMCKQSQQRDTSERGSLVSGCWNLHHWNETAVLKGVVYAEYNLSLFRSRININWSLLDFRWTKLHFELELDYITLYLHAIFRCYMGKSKSVLKFTVLKFHYQYIICISFRRAYNFNLMKLLIQNSLYPKISI